MALHGEVKITAHRDGVHVGDEFLAIWSARRQQIDPGDLNTYDCVVYTKTDRHEFTLEHRYSDGALILASKVLSEAAERERRRS